MGLRFLENTVIVKTAKVEIKDQWEKGGSVPGLRENIMEGGQQPEMNPPFWCGKSTLLFRHPRIVEDKYKDG